MARSWTLQCMNMFAWRDWTLSRGTACTPKCGGWLTEAMGQRTMFWSPKQAFKRYWLWFFNNSLCHVVFHLGIAKSKFISCFL
jgi:hypothetical protein